MIKKILNTTYPLGYRVLYAVTLSGLLLGGVGRYAGIPEAGIFHLLILFITIGLLACMNYGKANIKLVSISVFILLTGIIIPLLGAGRPTEFYRDYTEWLRAGFVYYEEELNIGYELVQVVWMGLIGYVAVVFTEKRALLRDITGIGVLAGLLVCMFRREVLPPWGVVFALVFILLCYVERLQCYWERKRFRDRREYILWLIPFLALYFVILQLLPMPERPYDWMLFRQIYANVSERVTILAENIMRGGGDDFGISMTGFSEDAGLSGDIVENKRHVMTIRKDKGHRVNIYLTGKTYDSFDGCDWIQTDKGTLREMPFDRLETEYAVRRREGAVVADYLYVSGINITYEHFRTACLFAPMKLRGISDAVYMYDGRDIVFDGRKGSGTEYGLTYFQLNTSNPDFYPMLAQIQPDNEEAWENVLQNYSMKGNAAFGLEQLKAYRAEIKELYGEAFKPTEKLEVYLNDIYEGCSNDIEKLRALETELGSYVYTTSPGAYPEEIDTPEAFLEYFLLEKKEGYCSYFATAFVLLARELGYPARYVQGFCVPMTGDKEVEVTSDMVHAWPEVYVEGAGWIPFEPTPGYYTIRNKGWKVMQVEEENVTPSVSEKWEPWRDEEELLPDMSLEEGTDAKALWKERLRILAMGAVAACLMGVLALWLDSVVRERRYRRMTTQQKFLVEVGRNLWLCEKLGCKRADNETLSELQDKLSQQFAELLEDREEFVFMQYYQEYLYRSDVIPEEVLQQSIEEREALLHCIRRYRKWYYYILRFRIKIGFH